MNEELKNIIPTDKNKRGEILTKTAIKAAYKKTGYLAKSLFIPKKLKEKSKNDNNEEIAQLIFTALSQLKGTALKIAQMLSMETGLVPESIRRELTKANYRVPPISRAMARKLIKNNFESTPENIFKNFESTPFAAASLGQVHEAADEKGNKLAVKIQYPQIAETIKSDIEIIRGFLRFANTKIDMQAVLDMIKTSLLEETDYNLEAERTKWFYNNYSINNIVIPEVIKEYSNKNIFTTLKIEGIHIDKWLHNSPTQNQINNYAELFIESLYFSVFKLQTVNTDPNTGNFLFMPDGKLGLIDFGAVKKLHPSVVYCFRKIIEYGKKNKPMSLIEVYKETGLININTKINKKMMDGFSKKAKWLSRLFSNNGFDFNENPDFLMEGVELSKVLAKAFNGDNIKEFAFLDRIFWGTLRILEKMNAKVFFNKENY